MSKSDDNFAELVAKKAVIWAASEKAPQVLVRLAIPRWSVIQWWLCRRARDVRTLSAYNSSAGSPAVEIRAALRNAVVRTFDLEDVADRVVQLHGSDGPGTLRQAAAPHSWLGNRPRIIAYEYTGSRQREHERSERRRAQAQAQSAEQGDP